MAIIKKPAFEGKLHIKTGDNVQIISGKDKGKQGKVIRAIPKQGKVVVEGLNMVTKHVKANPTPSNPNPEGGRIQKEAAILACKVMLVNSEGKPTRIRFQTDENGNKTRIAVKGGQPIPEPTR